MGGKAAPTRARKGPLLRSSSDTENYSPATSLCVLPTRGPGRLRAPPRPHLPDYTTLPRTPPPHVSTHLGSGSAGWNPAPGPPAVSGWTPVGGIRPRRDGSTPAAPGVNRSPPTDPGLFSWTRSPVPSGSDDGGQHPDSPPGPGSGGHPAHRESRPFWGRGLRSPPQEDSRSRPGISLVPSTTRSVRTGSRALRRRPLDRRPSAAPVAYRSPGSQGHHQQFGPDPAGGSPPRAYRRHTMCISFPTTNTQSPQRFLTWAVL